jgi:hypothetical protein
VCPQCGFDWTLTEAVALDLVSTAPSLYSRAFAGRARRPLGARRGGGDWARAAYEAPGGVWAWDRDDGWTDRGHALRWAAHEVVHHENDVRWGLS